MKRSKYVVALATLLIGSQTVVLAQEKKEVKPERKQPTKEQMIERQCSRIVDELALDDKTSAKFTEVYKKYMEEMSATCEKGCCNADKEKCEKGEEPKASPTDAEVEEAIKSRFAHERKVLDIRESYYTEFRKILSAKQIQKIYNMEQKNGHRPRKGNDRRNGMRPQLGQPQPGCQGPQPKGEPMPDVPAPQED